MKQTERHHLKENELANTVAAVLGPRQREVVTGVAVVVVLLVVVVAGLAIRQRGQSRRQAALAEAMLVLDAPVQAPTPAMPAAGSRPATPETQAPGTYPTDEAKLLAAVPKLQAAADDDPTSESALMARYHLASTFAALGRGQDALAAYDAVIAKGGSSFYAGMAKLGKATTQARMGQFQPAIETFKALADEKETSLPVDAVLMQLAAAYEASGNVDEAKKVRSRVVHEFPVSPYSTVAGKLLQ